MTTLLDYLWPAFGAGAVIGVVAGLIRFRRKSRPSLALALGAALALAAACLWHGPLGGADQLAARVERGVQRTLVYYDMAQIRGHLHHNPLTRRVLLAGPADDFQRSELVRLMNDISGVSSTTWDANAGAGLPLIIEGCLASLLGFLLGLLVAYVVELRRRYNAQWNW